jgi:hypothetical protein
MTATTDKPKGMKAWNGVKIAVKFKPKVFEQIKARAIEHKKEFSDIVNDVCECGLLDLEDSERDEPDYVTESHAQ